MENGDNLSKTNINDFALNGNYFIKKRGIKKWYNNESPFQ